MNAIKILTHLFPAIKSSDFGAEMIDGKIHLFKWDFITPPPTQEELEAAWVVMADQMSASAQLRTGLIAAWDAGFTSGEKAFLKPIFDAALARFDAGDLAGAKEIVATAPSITEALDTKRAAIVALFPEI